MDKFKTAVTGAVTPVGGELVKLLLAHPMCELSAVSSSGHEGRMLGELMPEFMDRCDMPLVSESELIDTADIVFNADLSLDAQELAAACVNGRSVLIDLSSDFRFNDQTSFAQWHGGQYLYPTLHDAALCCIPEFSREELAGKVIVSCPGAVTEAAVIALAPLLADRLIYPDNISVSVCLSEDICDRSPRYSGDAYYTRGSLRQYRTGELSDTGEIENMLSWIAGTGVRVTLMPCAVPSERGLLITCCARTHTEGNEQNLRASFEKMYAAEHFIRLLPRGASCSTAYTAHNNFCDVSVTRIERTGSAAITCAMDYYMKGSAGNAIQIMNALLNMPEYAGLETV